jgi:hypothetical protein
MTELHGEALLDAWVAELESGNRVQGEGCMRKHVDGTLEECCLGVLADVLNPSGWVKPSAEADKGVLAFLKQGDYGYIDDGLLRKRGLIIDQGEYVNYNDRQHLTFEQIAQKVREREGIEVLVDE